MSKTIFIGGRLESKEKGNVVAGANAIKDDTKGKMQNVINKETDDELLRLEQSKQDNLTFDNAPTEDSTNPVTSGGVYTAEKALSDAIEAILLLIPSAATALNKLVDTNTMNSSISTATATFRGTYNAVSDLGLTYQATHAQIEAALDALGLTADNNDYAFVQVPVSDQSQDIAKTERYKNNGTNWQYEYDLNTSGFTSQQWAAINSGITAALVTKLTDLPTAAALQLALNAKQDVLTFDTEPTALSQNPVTSGGIYTAIQAIATALSDYSTTTDGRLGVLEGLIPSEAASNNKLTDKAYVDGLIQAITELIPAEATTSNQLADKAYVLAQILAATPAFKGQFVTLAELQAVASPKAGDLGIVRTKDSDGMDVFTVYQYLNNAWNVFYSLSYHPQNRPATTGTTGDYPYNGMGRVELAKNMVNTGTDLEPVMVNTLTQDMFYKGEVGSRVPNTNTIFVIQYDYELSEDITIPSGCVLKFDGGSISDDGTHVITYQNTDIEAPLYPIFKGIIFNGTLAAKELYLDWFEDDADCSVKFIGALNAIKGTAHPGEYTISLAAKEYTFNTQVNLDSVYNGVSAYLHIKGQGECSVIKNNYGQESYQADISTIDYLFLRSTSGDSANSLIDIKLSDFLVYGKTTVENNNQGFLANKGGWVNDANIHDIKTWFIANVFFINRAYWVKIHQCCFREGVDLVYLTESNSSSYTNNQFRGCTGCGLYINGGHGTNITGNDFSADHIGIKITGGLAYAFTIMGNYFEVGSNTQQNYEMVIGDTVSQKFQNFTIANNSGLDEVTKYSDSQYFQYYGLVVNGGLYNCILDCTIAKMEFGASNSGHIMLNEELITEDDIADKFAWYTIYNKSNQMYLANTEFFKDNRYLKEQINNLQIQVALLTKAQASDVNTKLVWEDVNGFVYEQAALDSYDYFQNASRKEAVKIIHNMKRTTGYTQNMFEGCVNLESIPSIAVASSAYKMFAGCKKLKYIPVLDMSVVDNANSMFNGSGLLEFPLIDLSHVNNTSYMFQNCKNLVSVPLLDLSNVSDTAGMFASCSALKHLGGLKNVRTNLDIHNSRWLTAQSVDNIIEAAYNWATNPSSYPTPSGTPTVYVSQETMNRLSQTIKDKFPAKGWAVSLW